MVKGIKGSTIKQVLAISVAAGMLVFFGAFAFFSLQKAELDLRKKQDSAQAYRDRQGELQSALDEQAQDLQRLEGEYDALKAERSRLDVEHDALSEERNALLMELKQSDTAGDAFEEGREKLERLRKNKEVLEQDRHKMLEESAAFKTRLENLLEAKKKLKNSYERLSAEKQQVLDQLAELRQEGAAEIMLRENELLLDKKAALLLKLRSADLKLEGMLDEQRRLIRQMEGAQDDLKQVSEDYAVLENQNKRIEEKLFAAPAQFTELSRQNQILESRIAGVHYNLGVYYLQKNKYSWAVKEFRKSLKERPADFRAHFNLGYIYAEHLIDRARAIRHFQKYLESAPPDDKDRDWVRKYIAVWQAFSGSEPMR